MHPRGILLLALCAACPKPAPKTPPAASPPAADPPPPATTGAGWFCYRDEYAGGACYRTKDDCEFDLELIAEAGSGGEGEDVCQPAPSAICLSYTSNEGQSVQSCMLDTNECTSYAQFLDQLDDQGQRRTIAGSITTCAETQ